MSSLQAQTTAEETAYNRVIANRFTKIYGLPSRKQFNEKRMEVVEALSQFKSSEPSHGEWGFAGYILSDEEYAELTNSDVAYEAIAANIPQYDPAITNETPEAERNRMEAEWDQKLVTAATFRGATRGCAENFRHAFDEEYYEELKHRTSKYKNVTIVDHLDHLDTEHCQMEDDDIEEAINSYKRDVVIGGGGEGALTLLQFGKQCDDEQEDLARDGVTITDEEKKRYYLKQIRRNGLFDKHELGAYHKKSAAQRSWERTKKHFQDIVKLNKKLKEDEINNIRGGGYGSSGLEAAMLAREQYEQNQQAIEILKEIKNMQASSSSNNNNSPPTAPYCQPVKDTANAVVGDNGANNELIQGLMKTVQALTASVEKLQQGQENTNPNTTFVKPDGPACKHCGKIHPNIPGHWLGTEEECPGRDWPNNVKGHIADGVDYFIKRMNKRTGKDYKPDKK